MKECFSQYIVLKCPIRLYPGIVEQFRLREERDCNFHISIQKDNTLLDDREPSREQMKFSMRIDIEEIPSVTLNFTQDENVVEREYLLTYCNAIMVESILKRMLQHGND